MHQTLYTRHAHGNLPVHVLSEVPGGEVLEYQGAKRAPKELLQELYGKPVTLSWRRYFRLQELAPETETSIVSYILTLPKSKTVRPARLQIGVDLEGRLGEVRKIIYKGFKGRILAAGFELEDVIQEIFLGLLIRNGGRCPWDPRKGSMGHYIHMVVGCLLANHHRKESRRPERNADPLPSEQGTYGLDDTEVAEALTMSGLKKYLDDGSEKLLQQLLQGKTRSEIASNLGYSDAEVARGIQRLRSSAQPWKNSQGLH